MIKRFNIKEDALLSSVIDDIENSLQCLKYKQVANKIEIYPLIDRIFRENNNKVLAEMGFGNCLLKMYDNSNFGISIIINMQKCIQANLTKEEIAAVVLHELGHILNEPELQDEPTFEYCYIRGISFNSEALSEVQESNSQAMEIFADSYANEHGYGNELISTFHKQDKNFEQKIGYSSIRIDKILKKEYFNGRIMKKMR